MLWRLHLKTNSSLITCLWSAHCSWMALPCWPWYLILPGSYVPQIYIAHNGNLIKNPICQGSCVPKVLICSRGPVFLSSRVKDMSVFKFFSVKVLWNRAWFALHWDWTQTWLSWVRLCIRSCQDLPSLTATAWLSLSDVAWATEQQLGLMLNMVQL